ncbi:MAG TPA: hypothetical protein VF008_04075 [Niastella sp.]
MRILTAMLCCWFVHTCHAQTKDSASLAAAFYFNETAIASRNQHIWNAQLYGPTLFVEPQSRITYANMPDSAQILKRDGDIYKGVLPKEVMIANTSIFWQGKMWSVILWPLPADRDERINLVLHESFHRIQHTLELPDKTPTIDHLSNIYGRIYFLLELQALKAALRNPVSARSIDLSNALLFREKRRKLFPATFNNERILEMSEGLAEYTGVLLGRQPDSIRQHLYNQIDSAQERKSLIRSCAYITGPAYGYLLYEKFPGWTLQVDSNSDFPALISKYYHIHLPKHHIDGEVAAREKKYNSNAIIASEKIKEEKRRQTVHQYVDLFTRQPVLTINLIKMNIVFNPNTLVDLGTYGTIYPTAEVKDAWGQLMVTATGMLMKDWKIITLPADGIYIKDRVIEGKDWKLQLNEHWEMVKVDELHLSLAYNGRSISF